MLVRRISESFEKIKQSIRKLGFRRSFVGSNDEIATPDLRAWFSLARGYYRVARPTFTELDGEKLKVKDLGLIFASASNLVFSCELYLKLALALEKYNDIGNDAYITVPSSHNLATLFGDLRPETRNAVKADFEARVKDYPFETGLGGLYFQAKFDDAVEFNEDLKNRPEKSRNLRHILQSTGASYTNFRYIFAGVTSSRPLVKAELHYGSLLCLCEGIHEMIYRNV